MVFCCCSWVPPLEPSFYPRAAPVSPVSPLSTHWKARGSPRWDWPCAGTTTPQRGNGGGSWFSKGSVWQKKTWIFGGSSWNVINSLSDFMGFQELMELSWLFHMSWMDGPDSWRMQGEPSYDFGQGTKWHKTLPWSFGNSFMFADLEWASLFLVPFVPLSLDISSFRRRCHWTVWPFGDTVPQGLTPLPTIFVQIGSCYLQDAITPQRRDTFPVGKQTLQRPAFCFTVAKKTRQLPKQRSSKYDYKSRVSTC